MCTCACVYLLKSVDWGSGYLDMAGNVISSLYSILMGPIQVCVFACVCVLLIVPPGTELSTRTARRLSSDMRVRRQTLSAINRFTPCERCGRCVMCVHICSMNLHLHASARGETETQISALP